MNMTFDPRNRNLCLYQCTGGLHRSPNPHVCAAWLIVTGFETSRSQCTQPFKASRLLYVPPGLTLKNSTWFSYYVYVFCMDLRTDSDFCRTQH